MNKFLLSVLALVGLLYSHDLMSQHDEEHHCILMPITATNNVYVPPPKGWESDQVKNLMFEIEYIDFLPEAIPAFEYALSIWASLLESDVPIRVEARMQDMGGLGFGGTLLHFQDFEGAPVPGVRYASALADKLAGEDLNPFTADMTVTLSSTQAWYYSTDGACPDDQYDFISVVLHEIGHGLGFASSALTTWGDDPVGYLGDSTDPVKIFDEFLYTWQGDALNTIQSGTEEMYSAFVDTVYFHSPRVDLLESMYIPQIYTGYPFFIGSSLNHWEEEGFSITTVNSLMTPLLAPGQAIHDPGPLTMALLFDIGWAEPLPLGNVGPEEDSFVKVGPVPVQGLLNINFDEPIVTTIMLYDDRGRLLRIVQSDEHSLNLDCSMLPEGTYFLMFVQDGQSTYKKVMKIDG